MILSVHSRSNAPKIYFSIKRRLYNENKFKKNGGSVACGDNLP